jgi:RNA polymerase sigma-70 factor (ECF subfamily)
VIGAAVSDVAPRPAGSTVSDAALMRDAQAGDPAAFAELYDRHHAAAHRVAQLICRGEGAGEDALQDGFVSAWRGRASYRPDRGDVRKWLISVVRNRAIDIARRETLRERRRADLAPLVVASASVDVQADAIAASEAERVRRLVGNLPEGQREVIALAFYGELTHAEIAVHLGLPPGTVKGRMRGGLRRLSEGLAEAA